MKILLKYPTRIRPHKSLKLLKKYIKYMSGDNYEFILSCDNNDPSMREEYVEEVIASYDKVNIFFGNNKNKVEAINADMDKCLDYDIVLLVSDDMIPIKKGYDDIIRQDMQKYFPDTDGILWYNDGHRTDLNTLCILGRKYYERFNYIYHPDYKSYFSDDEFTQVGNQLGKQQYIDNVIIEHQHPVWGFGQNDELYNYNLKYWKEDEDMFAERKKKNFDL